MRVLPSPVSREWTTDLAYLSSARTACEHTARAGRAQSQPPSFGDERGGPRPPRRWSTLEAFRLSRRELGSLPRRHFRALLCFWLHEAKNAAAPEMTARRPSQLRSLVSPSRQSNPLGPLQEHARASGGAPPAPAVGERRLHCRAPEFPVRSAAAPPDPNDLAAGKLAICVAGAPRCATSRSLWARENGSSSCRPARA